MGEIKDASEILANVLSEKATITLIVAKNQKNIIGVGKTMAWTKKEVRGEQTYFKYVTQDSAVIMGRSSYEDIPIEHREMPGRQMIILTTNREYKPFSENHSIANSFEEAIHIAKLKNAKNIFIAGGGKVYEQAIKEKTFDTALITEVDINIASPEVITFFPQLSKKDFLVEELKGIKGENWELFRWTRITN
ncbi:MAG: dihydrofolate reductase [Alphaproteobacteria bacterium]|jgi:dihydrofolate reductase|nr:dihydrofolate reductase [Alphaproteobacteria bacterium]